MLYVIYGADSHKARKKLHELLDIAKKKRPDAELFKLTTENWSEPQLDELLVSKGLFESKYTVVLDNLFEKKDIKAYIVEKLKEISESEQVFLMLESSIDAATLKKIEKNAKQVQEFVKAEGKKSFGSVFSVTDGILERDRKKLWISLIDFLYKRTAVEEIHGIFFWQIKNMLLASFAKSQTETGLSPFVYTNALRGARKYKTEEILKMSSELVEMTHKVRSGEGELEIMMEKWVLGI
jgi:DNA polymerase III delta subunit